MTKYLLDPISEKLLIKIDQVNTIISRNEIEVEKKYSRSIIFNWVVIILFEVFTHPTVLYCVDFYFSFRLKMLTKSRRRNFEKRAVKCQKPP